MRGSESAGLKVSGSSRSPPAPWLTHSGAVKPAQRRCCYSQASPYWTHRMAAHSVPLSGCLRLQWGSRPCGASVPPPWGEARQVAGEWNCPTRPIPAHLRAPTARLPMPCHLPYFACSGVASPTISFFLLLWTGLCSPCCFFSPKSWFVWSLCRECLEMKPWSNWVGWELFSLLLD